MGSCTIRSPRTGNADYLFDPGPWGDDRSTTGERRCRLPGIPGAKDVRLTGSEKIAGEIRGMCALSTSSTSNSISGSNAALPVTKFEYRKDKTYRTALSEWSDLGVFPLEVTTKNYLSERLISEATFEVSKWRNLSSSLRTSGLSGAGTSGWNAGGQAWCRAARLLGRQRPV